MADPKTDNNSVKAQAKMNFADLRYLAFEGGGGKGAIYKGAIVALEKLFEKSWGNGDCLRILKGEIAGPEPDDKLRTPSDDLLTGGISILDYYLPDKSLKIKGISGASAGAITALPLALGLTSDDIDRILVSFRFKERLLANHNLAIGRYRMVGMNEAGQARLLVAEDRFRKLGEENIQPYQVRLFENDNRIGNSFIKGLVRDQIVAAAFSIIFTGCKEQWTFISRKAGEITAVLQRYNYLKKGSAWIRSNVVQEVWSQLFGNAAIVKHLTSFTPVPLNSALKWLLKLKWLNRLPWGSKHRSKLLGVLPADNIVSAVGNVFWDRGIYAGFEIRELAFKILILAISNDTHFSREIQRRTNLLKGMSLTAKKIKEFTVSFDNKFEIQASPEARPTLVKLKQLQEKLTFKELYDITHVNLTICVTNATTAQPVYFSHYFTPDFPVLEAVGASMSFPIAFKPVYSEANVLLHQETREDVDGEEKITRTLLNPSTFVKFKHHGGGPIVFKESFSMREYNKHLGVVLAYVKKMAPVEMSVNGNLSFRSFLPYLREIIETEKFKPFDVIDPESNASETYDAGYMKALCYFYYNSAFKGLLLDGGVTNNLPVGIFTFDTRSKIQDLDIKKSVLALKLDNSFPEAMRTAAFEILKKDPKTLERLTWEDEDAHIGFVARVFKTRQFRKLVKKQQTLSGFSKPVLAKLSRELVAEFKRDRGGFTPWNKQQNIIMGLSASLQFGLDQGQIESIADNANIVPLYCYGLSVFDFDLTSKDLEPLVDLAVEESEKQVWEYFKGAWETSKTG